jgi:PAS domain S-box-containing protein
MDERSLKKELSSSLPFAIKEAPIAIYEIDLVSLRFKWVNSYVKDLLGYDECELLELNVKDFLSKNSLPIFRENIRKALENKQVFFESEVEIKTKSGLAKWGHLDSKVIFENGKPSSALVFAIDITNRKKAEEALRQSEERFSKAFNNSPVLLAITRVADNRIVAVNDTFLQVTQYRREEVVGHTSREINLFINPDKRDQIFDNAVTLEKDRNREMEVRTRIGKALTMLFSGVVIQIGGENHMLSTAIDITDFRKSQKELKSVGVNLRNIIDTLEEALVIADIDGKILECNNSTVKLSGFGKNELIGKNAFELFLPEEQYQVKEEALKVLETGKDTGEFRVLRKDKSQFWAEISATALYNWNEKPLVILGVARDITERKKAEEALRESEKLYHTLFDNSEDGFMLLEPIFDKKGVVCDLRFLKFNSAYKRQTGARAEDILGKLASEVAPDLETEIIQLSGKVSKTGKAFHKEAFNKYSSKWYDSYYFLFAKQRVGILFRDITARKDFEKTITESKEKFENLFDQNPSVLELYDLNGYQIRVNNAWDRLYLIPREYTLGKYNVKTSKQVIDQGWFKYILRAYGGETVTDVPELEYDPSLDPSTRGVGRKRWLSTVIYPIKNSDGEVTNIVIAHEDVTDRKHAEAALIESEERYRQLFTSMTEMFFSANIICDQSGKVTDFVYKEVNPAFEQFFGFMAGQVIGKSAKALLGAKNIEDFWLKTLDEINKTGQAYHGEQFSKRNGKHYDVYAWKISECLAGVIFEDITQRKALEKQLTDNERLAAIGQIAGMVGHDIRNPLQAIVSELFITRNAIEEDHSRPDREEALESVNFIQAQVDYINKIVSDLQDYARIIVPEYSIADLSDVFVHVFETVRLPESISLSVNVKDAEKIRIDPTLLQRAITNLVNNAIQAMPKGGKLEVCGEKKDSRVVVTVTDTGDGIPDEIKPKLFTPMMTTKAKGQGFGLAASKRMIEAMKGTISFESEVGKGTKFVIELPAQ